MSGNSMCKVDILVKYFGLKKVLEKIKFDINEGEFISIIGPSGCGKSTLLRILSKLENKYSGNVVINCKNLSFMFQEDRLLPWLSIKENLLLVSKNKDIDFIKELLKIVNLEEFLEEYPKVLSGGMKKKAALVRTFVNRPDFVLLDEPFTSLDYPTSMELKEEFLKLCKKFNSTVILVTHDISEAILFSNRIFFLSKEPAKIILEYKNSHDQSFDLKRIDEIKNSIFEEYPNILKGVIL